MSILIENLVKTVHNQYILNHLNLEIQTGKLVTLLGPSGSGKSTLLRIIAGFEKADSGDIWLTGKNTNTLPIQDRQIGFVFQDYALFEHLTVFDNIAFGMRIRQIEPHIIQLRVQELLQLIELENKSHSYPFQLSGGQKQRISFVRALAIEPKILLLDEPFGALDPQVRKNLRHWLCTFLNEIQVTTVLVTHDQHEAFEISDEIIIFKNGQIQQIGLAQELIDYPYTSFVQSFICP
uniref:Sulfate ABC transporter ATP-binding subunit n=1 Tax=Codium arabicum TaxID=221038 RepID=A0A386B0I9_CODAR|nr:Sulfate ABC transporter ATP-binding subunit [Codium arabicum]AYC65216.1 Sulfate ABC transporter ATP-binding subunit [Codium arabicum]